MIDSHRRAYVQTPLVRAARLAGAALVVAVALSACSGRSGPVAPAQHAAAVIAPRPAPAPAAVRSTPAAPVAPERSVTPPNPCAGNTIDQYVRVSLRLQHMWLCHDAHLDFQTAITSGASSIEYDSTPTGNFHIQGRDRNTVLTLNTGKQYDVKYWIPFSAPLYGFHDASWQTIPYGSQQYRTGGSHGCVHMPLTAIEYFYHWVKLGATVHIRA